MNEWKNIWKEEPPRDEDIIFMTGDEEVHLGYLYDSLDALRKSRFWSYLRKDYYDCDKSTDFADRVIYWHSLPRKQNDK